MEIAALALLVFNSHRLIEDTVKGESDLHLKKFVPLIASIVAEPLAGDDGAAVQKIVNQLGGHDSPFSIKVMDAKGALVAQTFVEDSLLEKKNAGKEKAFEPGESGKQYALPYKSILTPVFLDGKKVGSFQMSVFPTLLEAAERETIVNGVMIGAFALAATFLFLSVIGVYMTRDLKNLKATVESVAAGDFGARAPISGEDEVSAIGRAFNTLLENLQRDGQREDTGRALFQKVVEATQEGVWMNDKSTRLVYVNQRLADLLGYKVEEMLGRRLFDFMEKESRQIARLDFAKRAEGIPALRATKLLRKDGSEVWVNASLHPNFDEQGHFSGALGLVADISSGKKAEDALAESESRFRDLIEGSIEGIFIVDEDWKIVFANQAAAEIYSYNSPEELLELPSAGALIAPKDRDRIRGFLENRLAGQEVQARYEFQGVRRDGKDIWLMTQARQVEWEGKPAVQSTVIDISDRISAEEELRQAQKMEIVGQLTGGVAHDFNNLLTVILGNLEMLRIQVADHRRQVELVDHAISAGERGATLTQRLLAFSRRQALQPEVVDVNRLVSNMTDLLRRTFGETIEVETVLAGGLWPAMADSNQMENVLLNLAVNARDAMAAGGKVTIETANTRLDRDYALVHEEVTPGQYVMMAVSDSGTGMDSEVAVKAFEPFFTTKEVGRGSGLGLSMIYGFVKQSGGHVKIYTEPGQGTTVKVYMPRAVGVRSGVKTPPQSGNDVSRGAEKVLVVEDEESVRELAVHLLENLGYTALEANDSDRAMTLLEEHRDVALLFTDVVLSGSTGGVELARMAREKYPAIKVLFTSGYTENAIIHHGRLDDGVELLEKPFRLDSLSRRIRSILDEP